MDRIWTGWCWCWFKRWVLGRYERAEVPTHWYLQELPKTLYSAFTALWQRLLVFRILCLRLATIALPWQQLPCERNLYSLLRYLQAADPRTITCTQLMVSTTSLHQWCLQFQIHIQSRRGDGFVSVMEDCRETISQSLGLCHTEAHQPTTAPPPISSTNPLSCTLR